MYNMCEDVELVSELAYEYYGTLYRLPAEDDQGKRVGWPRTEGWRKAGVGKDHTWWCPDGTFR